MTIRVTIRNCDQDKVLQVDVISIRGFGLDVPISTYYLSGQQEEDLIVHKTHRIELREMPTTDGLADTK